MYKAEKRMSSVVSSRVVDDGIPLNERTKGKKDDTLSNCRAREQRSRMKVVVWNP
jgi:hypothetical protein